MTVLSPPWPPSGDDRWPPARALVLIASERPTQGANQSSTRSPGMFAKWAVLCVTSVRS